MPYNKFSILPLALTSFMIISLQGMNSPKTLAPQRWTLIIDRPVKDKAAETKFNEIKEEINEIKECAVLSSGYDHEKIFFKMKSRVTLTSLLEKFKGKPWFNPENLREENS